MSDPNNAFSSDYILDQYRKMNEIQWRGQENPDDISELEELYRKDEEDLEDGRELFEY